MSDRHEPQGHRTNAPRPEGRGVRPLGETVVVVVHHREPDALRACLQTLGEFAPDLRVVVVENGSRDQSVTAVRMIAVERPMVTLVEVPFCRGHAAGLNLGIDTALELAPDLGQILLLDVDSRVGPRFVDEMLGARRRHPQAGVLGSNILSSEHRASLFEQGRLVGRLGWPVRDARPASGVEFESDFVDLGGVLLTAEFLAEGHRFDSGYFSHLAEVDLCRTAREAGFEVWVRRTDSLRRSDGSPREIAWDPIAAQPTEILSRVAESRAYYCRKWMDPRWRVLGLARLLLADSFAGLCWSLSRGGRPRFLSTWIDGIREGLAIALPGQELEQAADDHFEDDDSEDFDDEDFDGGDFDDGDFEDGDSDDGGFGDGHEPAPARDEFEDDRSGDRLPGSFLPGDRDRGPRASSGGQQFLAPVWFDDLEKSMRSSETPETDAPPDLFRLDPPGLQDSADRDIDEFVIAFDDREFTELTGSDADQQLRGRPDEESGLASVFEVFDEEIEIVEHDVLLGRRGTSGRKRRGAVLPASERRPVAKPKPPGIRPTDLFRS